jgi:phytoene dehydrogenase-like protein
LALALEKRCKDLGVDIYLNSPVQKINVMDGIANSISLKDGTKIQADKIVANADAELVYNSLLDSNIVQANHERKKLARAEKSLAGFSLLIGLDNSKVDGELPQLKHHNVFFPENYDDEFEAIFSRNEPVPDRYDLYMCSSRSKMVKGENREAWFVLVNAPRHDPINGVDWRKNPEAYASKILMRLDALGLRVSERLDVMEFRTPADLEASVMAPGGSIYGTSSNGARAAFLRASNRSPISNLYCVGGSAHPGGGLPLVGMSAELVAEAIGRADGATSSGHNHH